MNNYICFKLLLIIFLLIILGYLSFFYYQNKKILESFNNDCSNNLLNNNTNLQNYNNINLPIYTRNIQLFNSPGELWCLQPQNQKYCKENDNYILTPNINPNITNNINYSNNSSFSKNLITTSALPNTIENPYPSNIQFSSDNKLLTQLMTDYLKNLKENNNKAIDDRHNPIYINTPKVFTEICQIKNYQADPRF